VLSLKHVRQQYEASGALNTLFAPFGFVDDHTFLTKRGHLGVVCRLAGVDYECLDESGRRDIVHRHEGALRLLDDRCRLYQYMLKRRITPAPSPACPNAVAKAAIERRAAYLQEHRTGLYEIDLFCVLLFEGLRPRSARSLDWRAFLRSPISALTDWLAVERVTTYLERELDQSARELHEQVDAFCVHLNDSVRPERQTKEEAFRFFRRLVNYDAHVADSARLKYETHLDYFMSDSSVECHREHLEVGGVKVKILTAKEPPSATYPLVLEDLYTIPGEVTACLEWKRIPTDRMRRDLHARRRHHFNRRVNLVNYVSQETRADELLVDESADATVRQLGEALTDTEVHGHFFGEWALTIVLHDCDARVLDRSVAEARKVLTSKDGAVIQESYNSLNAWLATVPGNSPHNLRRMAVLETHAADLAFLFTLDRGAAHCAYLDRECLATFETQHSTVFDLCLHVDDVGHSLVVGATGAGKSFLLNFLLAHALRYDPLIVIFDLGRGFQKLAHLTGGSFLTLGIDSPEVQINPFGLSPTPKNLHFLANFVGVLLEGRDGARLSDAEEREVFDAVENLYVLAPEQRRLFSVMNLLPRALALRLAKWVEGGRYGALFDHPDDELSVSRFQVFNLEQMQAWPDLLEPLLFYVLHRVGSLIQDPAFLGLKLCVMDEAWKFIQHERLRAYVRDALKTWRKYHGAMLLATQSIDDFAAADLRETVLEAAPNKFLLANPGAQAERLADLFHLNSTELALLRDLRPRSQFLLKRPGLAKVLTLNVDRQSYHLYTNTPMDNARFDALVREHGFDQALNRLAAA
jgi:type IV secretion system protein TrbE